MNLKESWMDQCRLTLVNDFTGGRRELSSIESRYLYYGINQVLSQIPRGSMGRAIAPMVRYLVGRYLGGGHGGARRALSPKTGLCLSGFTHMEVAIDTMPRPVIVPGGSYFYQNMVAFLKLYPSIFVDNQYLYNGERCVIDAGANIGVFSLYAAMNGATKVVAFEPISDTFETFKRLMQANHATGIVNVENCALGDRCGTGAMSYNGSNDGGASFVVDRKGSHLTVPVVRLDEYCARAGIVPDFIKMDVEGYEKQAIEGAADLLIKHKPILCFSAYHNPWDQTQLVELVKHINPRYTCELHDRGELDCYCS